jgi:hypothetical protein
MCRSDSKQFAGLARKPRVHNRIHKIPSLFPVSRNPVHTCLFYFFKIYLILSSIYTPPSSKLFLSFSIHCTFRAVCPVHHNFFTFSILRILFLPLCSCCSHLEHRTFVRRFVSLRFLNVRHSVGLLGRVISPSQGRCLHTGQHKHNNRRIHRHRCLEWDSNPRSQRSSG